MMDAQADGCLGATLENMGTQKPMGTPWVPRS